MTSVMRQTVRRVGEACFPRWWGKIQAWRAAQAGRRAWDVRIADVLACPDNQRLARVPDAGRIVNGQQIMHNGLKVVVDGYYCDGVTRMLEVNRGCHEPQEEVVFDAIVRSLPPGAVMIEAGAYWGFYSLWFCQSVPNAAAFLIEPSLANMAVGQKNFQLNGYQGDFTNAYIGRAPGRHEDGTPIISIESFLAEKGLTHLNLLHADIQYAELEMLEGSQHWLADHKIDYLFISTHSLELHAGCARFLSERGYRILASVDLEETHSYDGVLVAASPRMQPPAFEPPAKKPKRAANARH